jgi:hypothetical protein
MFLAITKSLSQHLQDYYAVVVVVLLLVVVVVEEVVVVVGQTSFALNWTSNAAKYRRISAGRPGFVAIHFRSSILSFSDIFVSFLFICH